MTCPKCGAAVEASEWTGATRGAMAKAILLDWRTWVIAFAVMGLSGLLTRALGFASSGGVGGGAAVGMLVAMRMTRLRACPKCAAVVDSTP